MNITQKIIFISFVGLQSQQALAHAHLLESHPVKSEVLHQAPTEVSAKFSEDVEFAMSKIEVENLTTHEIVSGAKISNETNKNTLVVLLKPLKNEKANYQVSWKAVTKDSHTMKGRFDFTYDPEMK
jgi:methionine-rich copper-binding protein CopC